MGSTLRAELPFPHPQHRHKHSQIHIDIHKHTHRGTHRHTYTETLIDTDLTDTDTDIQTHRFIHTETSQRHTHRPSQAHTHTQALTRPEQRAWRELTLGLREEALTLAASLLSQTGSMGGKQEAPVQIGIPTHLIVQFPCFHFKQDHSVILYFFS